MRACAHLLDVTRNIFIALALLSPSGEALSSTYHNIANVTQNELACENKFSGIYQNIISQIKRSKSLEVLPLSCKQQSEINDFKAHDVYLTTGRSKGNATICVTNNQSYPCMFHVARLIDQSNPSEILLTINGDRTPRQHLLNETTERLFLRPTSLIR